MAEEARGDQESAGEGGVHRGTGQRTQGQDSQVGPVAGGSY